MNRTHTFLLPLSCAAMVMTIGGCSAFLGKSATKTTQLTVPIPSSGKCIIRSSNGGIRCVTGSVTEIEVEAVITARGSTVEQAESNLDEISIDTTESDAAAEIVANIPRAIRGGVSFNVTVPVEMELQLETSNGVIEVSGVTGDVKCKTSNGSARVVDCDGEVDIETSNGKVTIEGESMANVQARTSNGSVHVKGSLAEGSHQVRTSNGSIHVELTGTPVSVTSTTSNGSIMINGQKRKKGETVSLGVADDEDSESAELTLRTSNGSITVDHTK